MKNKSVLGNNRHIAPQPPQIASICAVLLTDCCLLKYVPGHVQSDGICWVSYVGTCAIISAVMMWQWKLWHESLWIAIRIHHMSCSLYANCDQHYKLLLFCSNHKWLIKTFSARPQAWIGCIRSAAKHSSHTRSFWDSYRCTYHTPTAVSSLNNKCGNPRQSAVCSPTYWLHPFTCKCGRLTKEVL